MSFQHLIKEGETWDDTPDMLNTFNLGFGDGDECVAFVFFNGKHVAAITEDRKTGEYSRWAYRPERYTKVGK
jgi:hypothetical protein